MDWIFSTSGEIRQEPSPTERLWQRLLFSADLEPSGSAQEFVETRILGCFLKNDEFGLGDRHALRLE
jgi:hypothetical protein